MSEGGGPAAVEREEGTVRYFAGIAGVSFPFKLYQELPEDEALRARKYFLGIYRNELLVRLERYIDGEVFFTHEYAYHDGGRIAVVIVRSPADHRGRSSTIAKGA